MDEAERLMFEGWATLPQYKQKVISALQIINTALELGEAYVAVSWGKDSATLLHLAQSLKSDILAIHWRTPQQELLHDYNRVIQEYCDRFPINYQEIDIPLETTIPTGVRQSRIWEQYPVALIGVRAEENPRLRGNSLRRYGAIHQLKQGYHRVWPLGWWSYRDVWAYVVSNDLPYLSSYDHPDSGTRERSRTTNVMPFVGGGSKSQRLGRIAQIRATAPEAYAFLREFYPEIASST